MRFNYSKVTPTVQAEHNERLLAPEVPGVDNLQSVTDLDKFFREVRELVDRALDDVVPPAGNEPACLYQAIRWSLFGEGKRFRPALVIAVGRLFSATDETLLRTAAGVEMLHTYSLIHDDLPAMDDDDLRRGRATAHKKFGEATAILAGDALQAMAFQTIAEDPSLPKTVRLRLLAELSIAAGQMVAGQQMDLEAEGRSVDISAIEKIHKGKTGALIGFAVRAGGLIAGAGKKELQVLTEFGDKLGLLFQVTDDILDMTSTSDELGKTAGKDHENKKATYPEVLGLTEARGLARELGSDAVLLVDRLDRPHSLLSEICSYVANRTS
jgi:geranylgeranyl pyrophosphate synthase